MLSALYKQKGVYMHYTETIKFCALHDTFQDVTNLYELFHTRAVLYQLAYKHKTTVIIEYM